MEYKPIRSNGNRFRWRWSQIGPCWIWKRSGSFVCRIPINCLTITDCIWNLPSSLEDCRLKTLEIHHEGWYVEPVFEKVEKLAPAILEFQRINVVKLINVHTQTVIGPWNSLIFAILIEHNRLNCPDMRKPFCMPFGRWDHTKKPIGPKSPPNSHVESGEKS